MSKNKLLIYLNMFFVVGFQFLLISCSSTVNTTTYVNPAKNPELVDQSWVAEPTCSNPCWQGLESGKSSQTDALATAHRLPFLGIEKVEPTDNSWISFLCKAPPEKVCISMRFEHGILTDLWLFPNYLVTMDQVVKKLGVPDSFYYSQPNAETPNCVLTFLWVKKQMALKTGDDSQSKEENLCGRIYKNNGKIPKDLGVRSVNYLSSDRLKTIIETIQKPDTGNVYMLWNGFSE